MSLRELKFSNQIQEEQIKSVYHKNFNYIVTERFYFQQQWLHAAYNRFKDFDKYLILIHLVHKTFKAYGDFQIKNSFDEFYAKETYEIQKINVIDLSKELLISKETTRRKILEMERDGAIKKDKKRIMINRKGQEYQKPKDSIRNMSRLLSKFTDFLSKAGYLDKKVENSVLDKKIRDNFTQIWTAFFEFQIPTIIGWKKFFGDIETWAIWAQCAYNQNLVMNKGFKENLSPELTSDNFVEKLNNWGNQGLNAMTISELSGIPRPTALRKLNTLIKRKLLKKDKNNLYLLFGLPRLDTNTIEKDVTLKTVRDINKSNEERFIRMLTRILNTIVFN